MFLEKEKENRCFYANPENLSGQFDEAVKLIEITQLQDW